MMYISLIVFALSLAICEVQSKVQLKTGLIERISFNGDKLVILVDNSLGIKSDVLICFLSSSSETYRSCPNGFTGAIVVIDGKLLIEALNWPMGPVEFNQDGTLNITVADLPDERTIVILENAELFKSEEPEEDKSVKKESKGAAVGIAFGVIGLILLIIGIGATVGICLYLRRNKEKHPIIPPEIVIQKPDFTKTSAATPTNNKKEERPSTPKTPNSPQMPAMPLPTPNAVRALEPKLATPPAAEPPATPPQVKPQPKPPATDPVEPLPKMITKAETPKVPTIESTEPTKEASVEPIDKQTGKQDSKMVANTLTVKLPSPPTPKFSNHPFSKAIAETSTLREKENVPFEETAGPLGKKINYAKVDAVTRIELMTESIRCYGMRNGKFTRHDNFILRERFRTRPHTVHYQEKDILKGAPSDAIDAANVLVERIERELRSFGYRPEYGLTQNSVLWDHLDFEEAEISKLYWLLLQMKPDLFKVEEQDVNSVEIQKMPVAMLYALILDTRLKRSFREELVVELRTSTVDIIRLASQDTLRLCAFPLNYLVLLYHKNPSRYVEGRKAQTEGNLR